MIILSFEMWVGQKMNVSGLSRPATPPSRHLHLSSPRGARDHCSGDFEEKKRDFWGEILHNFCHIIGFFIFCL